MQTSPLPFLLSMTSNCFFSLFFNSERSILALIMNYNQNLSALLYDRLLQFFILSSAGVWQDMDNTEESGRKRTTYAQMKF